MTSRNIRLVLAYDGTDFNGWQVQKGGRTVQGEFEAALSRMHKNEVKLTGAGRTDSGVHARGQVANFFSNLDTIPAEDFTKAVNSFLPVDIRVLKSEEVPMEFHARYNAKLRTYRYYFLPDTAPYPWERKYCLPLVKRPDFAGLMAMAEMFIGTHDFSALCSADEGRKSTVRRIEASSFFTEGKYLVYHIAGNAFLWKMVRSIVGTILEFEQQGRGPEDIRAVLQSGERDLAGPTAPAYPLFLHRVDYGAERR